ncbi:MAG: carbohydrate kinase family protein [bacterium]|nr:carbohydrate kinase family protein [bacterium]
MKSFDLISIGDTTHDVFLEVEEDIKIMKDQKGDEYLGMKFAEKIPVKKLTNVPAVGNAANVAVGASRLGLKTALYTNLGDDQSGREMRDILVNQENIAPNYIIMDRERASNYSTVINYGAERIILVYHEERNYSLPELAPSSWAYFSSVAKGHDKLHTQIPDYITKHKVKLGFNPGSFQLREGVHILRPIIEVCEVMFVNKEEAQGLVGVEEDIKILLKKLHDAGPRVAVITDGPGGSYSFDGTTYRFLEIFPSPLVERTGAGDAYSTGFLSALALDLGVADAMRWGTFSSAFVVGEIGAQRGLLTREKMEQVSKENSAFQPREI